MDFNEYTKEIVRISKLYSITDPKENLIIFALGLFGETGEVSELLKKFFRDGVLDKDLLAKELGDVLAYLTLIADTFGFTLEEIALISNLYAITDPKENLVIFALGLAGETGKVSEQIKKYFRDGVIDKELLAKELGDVLAYLRLLADTFGFTLEEIVQINHAKLIAREQKGTLRGSGDER
jgi:NTP pyrophosphatase (non-canonical NTP hydrolase)